MEARVCVLHQPQIPTERCCGMCTVRKTKKQMSANIFRFFVVTFSNEINNQRLLLIIVEKLNKF